MIRYISCLTLLLLITGVVSAQTGYVARKVSLGKAARTTSYIQVTVAGIPDTTCIGLNSKADDAVEILVADTSLSYWLQAFANRQVQTSTYQLWSFKRLRIQTGADSTGYARVQAEVWTAPAKDSQYQHRASVDTLLVLPNAGASDCIAAVVQVLAASKGGMPAMRLAKSAVLSDAGMKQSLPAKVRNGIYLTYDDFRENSPAITNFVVLPDTTQPGKVKVCTISSDSSQVVLSQLWGFSVNNELYYYTAGTIVPVENNLSLSAYSNPITRANQAMILRRFEFTTPVYHHDLKVDGYKAAATCINSNNGQPDL